MKAWKTVILPHMAGGITACIVADTAPILTGRRYITSCRLIVMKKKNGESFTKSGLILPGKLLNG